MEYEIHHIADMNQAKPTPLPKGCAHRRTHRSRRCTSARMRIKGVRPLCTMSALGEGISRDPIAEKGGLNLYAFVRNDSPNAVDPAGLFDGPIVWPPRPDPRPPQRPPQYPPRKPFPDSLLKKYDCSCCGAQEIADGKKELINRFNQAKAYLDGKKLKPDADADEPGEASCDTSNGAVLNFINPTPRCWICFMDNRLGRVSFLNYWDENFIHCYTVNNKGIKDELILDWFDSAFHSTSGVYGDVNSYYKAYPYPNAQYKNVPVFADCSKPNDAWKPDTSKFDFMFDPDRKDPPVNR